MKQYGIGTGLPDTPLGLDEENTKMLMPLYRALASLAVQLSDVTGVTVIPGVDIQESGPLLQHDLYRTHKLNFVASVNISYGRCIHLDNTAGESKLKLADSSGAVNLRAHGVCIEPGGITAGQRGRVLLFQGLLTGLSGLPPGTVYYLSTAGMLVSPAPGGAAFVQPVGIAISSSIIAVNLPLI